MTLHQRIRATAARLCSARTTERVIDPVLTDVEIEHRDATAAGRVWGSRWILVAGYFALVKVAASCGYDRTVRDWSGDDTRAFARTFGLSAAGFAVTVVLLISPPAGVVPAWQLPYLIPQALPLAIPVGLTLGIFCSLGGRIVSFRAKGAVLALAVACSAGSLATTIALMPAAGQAFRSSVSEHVRLTVGEEPAMTPGVAEMPISELRRKVDVLAQSGRAPEARRLAFGYYIRWALPCAPFVLALFALSVIPRRPVRRWVLAAAGGGACLSYYLLLVAADIGVRQALLPSVVLVWLPNLVLVVAAIGGIIAADRSRRSAHA
jgi:hypothetical protein